MIRLACSLPCASAMARKAALGLAATALALTALPVTVLPAQAAADPLARYHWCAGGSVRPVVPTVRRTFAGESL